MAEDAPIMEQNEHMGEKSPTILRGKVDSLTLYEITDAELDILEKGSPASIFLNFSILLISTASSFLIAILTATIESAKVFSTFVIIVVVGYIVGVILLFLWNRSRKSSKKVITRIKNRIQQPEEPQDQVNSEE